MSRLVSDLTYIRSLSCCTTLTISKNSNILQKGNKWNPDWEEINETWLANNLMIPLLCKKSETVVKVWAGEIVCYFFALHMADLHFITSTIDCSPALPEMIPQLCLCQQNHRQDTKTQKHKTLVTNNDSSQISALYVDHFP